MNRKDAEKVCAEIKSCYNWQFDPGAIGGGLVGFDRSTGKEAAQVRREFGLPRVKYVAEKRWQTFREVDVKGLNWQKRLAAFINSEFPLENE